jgi:hypothetical protein
MGTDSQLLRIHSSLLEPKSYQAAGLVINL